MNLLQVQEISKGYGEKELFSRITFGISEGQKVGLIARNGAGKSTLLKIMVGHEGPDEGQVVQHKNLSIGFLDQNPSFDETKTIAEVIYDPNNPVAQAIADYQQLLRQVEQNPSVANQKDLAAVTEKMDALQAWDYENRIREILFQFQITDLSQTIESLSGGMKKKIALAQVLMTEANLIILDEPTNHLDIAMIEWLERFLSKQKLAILLVTHDRYFLDRVCDEIAELDGTAIYSYKGNYDYFMEKRAERIHQQATEIEKAKNLYRKEIEWVRRQPKARTTKSKKRLEDFESLSDKAHQKMEKHETPDLEVDMNRMGKKILEVKHVSKSFGESRLIHDFSYTFKKGEHIGIVGPNGIGKSTFLNILTQQLQPDFGTVTAGKTIKFGYYSQEGMKVDQEKRLIEIASDVAQIVHFGKKSVSVSQFLSYFNFDHTTQYNYFEHLSGGEKRRFFLLLTLLKNPNFLILDEPTNDLDVFTLNLLETFLEKYEGCVLMVSHDRRFIDTLADHTFVFEGNGIIKDFPGNFTQYENYRARLEVNQEKEIRKVKKAEHRENKKQNTSRRASFKEKQEFESLTAELEQIEAAKAAMLKILHTETNVEKLREASENYERIVQALEEKETRWLALSEIIEP
jgi:ATP-binding cassette subfamily F protein uup